MGRVKEGMSLRKGIDMPMMASSMSTPLKSESSYDFIREEVGEQKTRAFSTSLSMSPLPIDGY